MSAYLVDTSDDESLLVVANFISQLLDNGQARSELNDTAGSAFYRECEDALNSSDYAAIIEQFIQHIDLIFEKAKGNANLQAALCVTVHLLKAVSGAQQASFAHQLASKLVSVEDEHVDQRLSVLTDVFNSTAEAEVQYSVLLQTVKFATAAGKATVLAPALRGNLEVWSKSWSLSKKQERDLLLAVAELFRTAVKRRVLIKEAYRLTVKALATLEDGSSEDLAAVQKIAKDTIAEFLNSQDVFQFDLLSSPAIAQLETDSEAKPLLELLQLVIAGNVKEAIGFLDRHQALQQEYHLNSTDLKSKTQLMAVVAMAARSSEVSYDALKDQLVLENDDDVEYWLVRAVGKRLIQGQMDQERRVVTISKAVHKAFRPEDWKLLQTQLNAWKDNVSNAREVMANGDSFGLNGSHLGATWQQNGKSEAQHRRAVQA